MNTTVVDAKARLDDNSSARIVAGVLHTVLFPLISLCVYVSAKKLYHHHKAGKATEGMKIVFTFATYAFLYEFTCLSSLPGGFQRSFLVEGNKEYETNQIGYLSSPPTSWCVITGLLQNIASLGMVAMAFCLIYNTHRLVLAPIHGKRRYSKAKSSEMRNLVQILRESPRLILNVFVMVLCIISISLTDYGPMALYCWTRCAENGIDAEFTNDGKCYMRLVTLYGWMILFGPCSMYLSLQVLLHLRKNANTGKQMTKVNHGRGKSQMKSKVDAIHKAARSIAIFTAVFGFIITLACIVRLRSSIQPDPSREGRVSLVEFGTAIISPIGWLCFGLPSKMFLDCMWKVTLDDYSKSKQVERVSRDTDSSRQSQNSTNSTVPGANETSGRVNVDPKESLENTNEYVASA